MLNVLGIIQKKSGLPYFQFNHIPIFSRASREKPESVKKKSRDMAENGISSRAGRFRLFVIVAHKSCSPAILMKEESLFLANVPDEL
jgi:hypothetical protein